MENATYLPTADLPDYIPDYIHLLNPESLYSINVQSTFLPSADVFPWHPDKKIILAVVIENVESRETKLIFFSLLEIYILLRLPKQLNHSLLLMTLLFLIIT